MLRLGHIDYSNCIPVHAALLDDPPAWLEIERGVPAQLNADLAARRIDVAPCSSIEYARHADYRLLPGLMIGADGPVESILLECAVPPQELDGRAVAVPTASATSVVLLRLLLEKRWNVRPRYQWFAQENEVFPNADAALWIGDAALRRAPPAGRSVLDLGAAWKEWTGLPFAFALWQTSAGSARDAELLDLHARLLDAAARVERDADALAARFAPALGLEASRLARYWRGLRYRLDDDAIRGVQRFFDLAAELGEAPAPPALRWVGATPA